MKMGSEIGDENAAEATKRHFSMAVVTTEKLDTAAEFAVDDCPLDPLEALRVRYA